MQKIRLIFVPFLIVSIGFALIYNIFYVLLLHNLYPFEIREGIIEILIPFALAWVPELIWIRPKINLLALDRVKKNQLGFQMLAVFIITGITFFTGQYTEAVAGKLTALKSIKDIDKIPTTKYYTIENYYIDKINTAINYSSAVSGRYNTHLNLYINIACPIYVNNKETAVLKAITLDTDDALIRDKYDMEKQITKSESDTVGVVQDFVKRTPVTVKGWLCVTYAKQLNNDVHGDRKKQIEANFYHESLRQFNDTNLTFTYFERLENNIKRDRFKEAVRKTIFPIKPVSALLLEGRLNPFEQRSMKKFWIMLTAFGIGLAIWLVSISFVKMNQQELNKFLHHKSDSNIFKQ